MSSSTSWNEGSIQNGEYRLGLSFRAEFSLKIERPIATIQQKLSL
jgi:hypothetical protein